MLLLTFLNPTKISLAEKPMIGGGFIPVTLSWGVGGIIKQI